MGLDRVDTDNIVAESITREKLGNALSGIAGPSSLPALKRLCGFGYDELPNSQTQGWGTNPGGFNAAGWTADSGEGTLSVDSSGPHGSHGLKIERGNAGNLDCHCTLPQSATIRGGFEFWLKINTTANLKNMSIYLYEDSSNLSNKHVFTPTSYPGSFQKSDGNWVRCVCPRDTFVVSGSPTEWGTNATKTVQKIRIFAESTGAIEITYADVMWQEAPKAGVIIGFDGPQMSVLTRAYPDMVARGWPGVAWTVASLVGTGSGENEYLSAADLTTLNDAGWDICSHGWDTTIFNGSTSVITIRNALEKASKYLNRAGYRGAVGHSWMGNAGDSITSNTGGIVEDYFLFGRGSIDRDEWGGSGSSALSQKSSMWVPWDWWSLPYITIHGDSLTDFSAGLEAKLDQAVRDRHVANIYTHQVHDSPDAGDISTGFWADLLTWLDTNVNNGNVEILTPTQWYNRIVGRPGTVRFGYDGAMYQIDGSATARRAI